MAGELIIKQSRTKITLVFFGSLGFVLIGFWLWDFGDSTSKYDGYLLKPLSVLSILFFGMCGIYAFFKIFDFRPGLVINEEGIVDNSSAIGANLIKWTDIYEVKVETIKGSSFLLVFVHNPEEYMGRINWFSRFWMRWNYRIYGTPLCISSGTLQCDFRELLKMIIDRMPVIRE